MNEKNKFWKYYWKIKQIDEIRPGSEFLFNKTLLTLTHSVKKTGTIV